MLHRTNKCKKIHLKIIEWFVGGHGAINRHNDENHHMHQEVHIRKSEWIQSMFSLRGAKVLCNEWRERTRRGRRRRRRNRRQPARSGQWRPVQVGGVTIWKIFSRTGNAGCWLVDLAEKADRFMRSGLGWAGRLALSIGGATCGSS